MVMRKPYWDGNIEIVIFKQRVKLSQLVVLHEVRHHKQLTKPLLVFMSEVSEAEGERSERTNEHQLPNPNPKTTIPKSFLAGTAEWTRLFLIEEGR
jgi:hypothetical protein